MAVTLTKDYQLIKSQWLGNNGYGDVYVALYAKYNSQNTAKNTSNVSIQGRIITYGGYWWSNSGTTYNLQMSPNHNSGTISCNGQYNVGETTLGTLTKDVSHNADGTLTLSAEATFTAQPWGWSATAWSELTLPKIPRYATCNQSLRARRINSLDISWSSDSTIDYVWYDINGQNTWTAVGSVNASSGYYTIPNLEPNSTYWIRTRVRRKDSQLTTDSTEYSYTTHSAGTITSAPNFNDEENPTITYSNPFGENVDSLEAMIEKDNVRLIQGRAISKTGNSYTFNFTEAERKILRETCKSNSMTLRFYIRTSSAGKVYWSHLERTMTIVNGNPTFNNFQWWVDERTRELCGSQKAIKNHTTITTYINSDDQAKAKKEATIKSYQTTIGTKSNSTTNISYPVSYDVPNVDGASITVFAIDSRDNSAPVSKPITLLDYWDMTNSPLQVARTQQVNSEVRLNFEGVIDLLNFGAIENSIKQVKYQYKEASSTGDFIDGATQLNVTFTHQQYSLYKFEVNQIIAGDLGANGFDIDKSYLIKIIVEDELSRVEDTATLGSGSPAIAMYKNNVALGGPYNESKGGRVQIPVDVIYPVGSIYMSMNETNPGNIFGGTWEQIQGRFLLGAGFAEFNNTDKFGNFSERYTFYRGGMGGEYLHTLSRGEMPSHGGHGFEGNDAGGPDAGEDTYYVASSMANKYSTNRPYVVRAGNELVHRTFYIGSSSAHNNMPPYLVVYMWKRTA